MKDEKNKKISFKKAVLSIFIILVMIFGTIFLIFQINHGSSIHNYFGDYGTMFATGIIICILVTIIVSFIVLEYNNEFPVIFSSCSNLQKYKFIKRSIIGIIIVALIFAVCYLSVMFYEAMTAYVDSDHISYKPIIYLYPTEEIELTVKLGNEENITSSYPQYENGWNVLANPSGNLINLKNSRKLYSLYYENKNKVNFKMENDGFIVKGNEVANFLEEKLAILGLNEREIEEFIIYWLPKLETNKYNYIRFATTEEINKNMPLEITPNPDTMIRVLMTFKSLENPINIQEQKLENKTRTGFVAVEWGGTEIK